MGDRNRHQVRADAVDACVDHLKTDGAERGGMAQAALRIDGNVSAVGDLESEDGCGVEAGGCLLWIIIFLSCFGCGLALG